MIFHNNKKKIQILIVQQLVQVPSTIDRIYQSARCQLYLTTKKLNGHSSPLGRVGSPYWKSWKPLSCEYHYDIIIKFTSLDIKKINPIWKKRYSLGKSLKQR